MQPSATLDPPIAEAIKIALGLSPRANNTLVYQEAGWLPPREDSRLNCAKFEARVSAVPTPVRAEINKQPTSPTKRKTLAARTPTLHARTLPFSTQTKDLWKEAEVEPARVTQATTYLDPPWELSSPTIDTDLTEGYTKKDGPLYLATRAKEEMERRYPDHLQIYTDGSVRDTQVGSAFFVPSTNTTKGAKLNEGTSIFTAELQALLMACKHLLTLPSPPPAAVILSDSKSSLQALRRGGKGDRKELQQQILRAADQVNKRGTQLTFCWLPAHCGIRGNEKADQAAKTAAEAEDSSNIGLSLNEVKAAVKKAAQKKWEEKRKRYCNNKGLIFLPGLKLHLAAPTRRSAKIISRIRTGSCAHKWAPLRCPCGTEATLNHVLTDCPALPRKLQPLWDYNREHGLVSTDLLQPHPTLGTAPMMMLAESIVSAGIQSWF